MVTTTTTLQNPNILQPTGFKVVINRKRFANLEFFANTVGHPSVNLAPAVTPFRRADMFQPGDKLTFDELVIDAIMDEEMYVYNEVYDWMTGLVEENIKPRGVSLTGIDDTSAYDISVLILNSANNVVRTITYRNAMITSVGSINFTTTTGVETITCAMSFRYDTFDFS